MSINKLRLWWVKEQLLDRSSLHTSRKKDMYIAQKTLQRLRIFKKLEA